MDFQWKVTVLRLNGQFKVTRRIPQLAIAETKVCYSKEEAMQQFRDWTSVL